MARKPAPKGAPMHPVHGQVAPTSNGQSAQQSGPVSAGNAPNPRPANVKNVPKGGAKTPPGAPR